MENIVLFVRLMVPTFLLTVGVASGPVTVGAGYQLMLLLIYGTEKILLGVVLPLIYSYCLLTMINGIWGRGKTGTFGGFTGKADRMDPEGFPGCGHRNQSVPVADHTGGGFLEKFRSGEGCLGTAGDRNAADGVLELALGSAVVIRNSVGVLLLLLLVAGCAVPLLQILFTAGFIKCATAFMGIVSDKRITNCTDRMEMP